VISTVPNDNLYGVWGFVVDVMVAGKCLKWDFLIYLK